MHIAKYINLVVGNLARISAHKDLQNGGFSESQMTKSSFFLVTSFVVTTHLEFTSLIDQYSNGTAHINIHSLE